MLYLTEVFEGMQALTACYDQGLGKWFGDRHPDKKDG